MTHEMRLVRPALFGTESRQLPALEGHSAADPLAQAGDRLVQIAEAMTEIAVLLDEIGRVQARMDLALAQNARVLAFVRPQGTGETTAGQLAR